MTARTYRVARSDIQRSATVQPSTAPASAPIAYRGVPEVSLWPAIRTPNRPTTELQRMNGGDSLAAARGGAPAERKKRRQEHAAG